MPGRSARLTILCLCAGCEGIVDPQPPLRLGWQEIDVGLSGAALWCDAVSILDADEDGSPDLIMPTRDGLAVAFRRGGRYEVPQMPSPADQRAACPTAVGDLDLDGHIDVAVSSDDNAIRVFFGDGRGGWERHDMPGRVRRTGEPYEVGADSIGVATSPEGMYLLQGLVYQNAAPPCGDAGHGGVRDGYIVCFLDIPHPTSRAFRFTGRTFTEVPLPFAGNALALGVLDVDGDGRDDVVGALDFAAQGALRGIPGGFEDATRAWGLGVRAHGMAVAIGDLDGDRDQDLVITSVGDVVPCRNDGGHFECRNYPIALATDHLGIFAYDARIDDLNADGWPDVFIQNWHAAEVRGEAAITDWLSQLARGQRAPDPYHLVLLGGPGGYREAHLPWSEVPMMKNAQDGGFSITLADLDDDGVTEILLPVPDGENYRLAVGHLTGVAYGRGVTVRAPLGSTVAVDCEGRVVERLLPRTEGYRSGPRTELHFGCDQDPDISVRFSSGKTFEMRATTRVVTIQENP